MSLDTIINAGAMQLQEELKQTPFFSYKFPQDKAKISKLTRDEKMEWYGHQFQVNSYEASVMFSTKEFESYWRWRVAIPIKIQRFFYKVKNGQIFRRYEHINQIRAKRK